MWAQAANQWDKDHVSELGKTLSKLYCYFALPCFREFFLGGFCKETLNTAIKGSAFLKREEINCVNGRKSCILSLSAEKKMQLENSAGTHAIGVERGKQRAKKHGNGVKRGKRLARLGKRIKRGNTRSPLNVTSDHFANGLVFFCFVLYRGAIHS